MSWMPSNDPILGDPQTCDALELMIVPRTRDLGDGFAVRRALPHGKRQMVGPFIFFDHMGPIDLARIADGLRVRFALPPGTYATVLLDEIMKSGEPPDQLLPA